MLLPHHKKHLLTDYITDEKGDASTNKLLFHPICCSYGQLELL